MVPDSTRRLSNGAYNGHQRIVDFSHISSQYLPDTLLVREACHGVLELHSLLSIAGERGPESRRVQKIRKSSGFVRRGFPISAVAFLLGAKWGGQNAPFHACALRSVPPTSLLPLARETQSERIKRTKHPKEGQECRTQRWRTRAGSGSPKPWCWHQERA